MAIDIVNGIRQITKQPLVPGSVSIVPPKKRYYVDKLKDAGIEYLTYNLEVFDPSLFRSFCPGKDKIGRDYYMDELDYAVKLFGEGKVRSNFVAGLEPLDSLLAGFRELAEIGVVSTVTLLHLKKGTDFEKEIQRPGLEYYIKLFREMYKINNKFGFRPPWNHFCESHSLDDEGQFLT
jgi:hypothetical protein